MKDLLAKYRQLDIIGRLIAINILIWAATQLARLGHWLFTGNDFLWQQWLALSSDSFQLITEPWTLLTYMFVHANFGTDVFHIIFNMMWLYWFGKFYMRYHTGRQLLGTYILGGLASGVFYILCFAVFPYLYQLTYNDHHVYILVGASGAIFALVGAVAIRQPNEAIYMNFIVKVVPVKMKWFALGALVINLMNITGANMGGIICHLGGLLFGVICGYGERSGYDMTRHFNLICDNVTSFWQNNIASLFHPKPKMKATKGGARSFSADRRMDQDYNRNQNAEQERIDAILDKISKNGYDNLTAEEKAILFDASRRRR